MTHAYAVKGMTCQSCAANVKQAVEGLDGIEQVDVDLAQNTATVKMRTHVPTQRINDRLRSIGDYELAERIEEASAHAAMTPVEEADQSFKPLILVLTYILVVVLISEYQSGQFDWMEFMRKYMGGFFLAFSFFKLLDLKGFAYSYASYDILTKAWMPWGFIYPFVELALGVAFLAGFNPTYTAIATIIVMGVSSIGVIRAVLNKQRIPCACLGTGFNLPMSTVTVIEDVGMVLMAVLMLLF